jgi:hypothetical protein
VADSVVGPTSAITVLKESGLLERLPKEGGIADLAYVGIAEAHPQGLGASPRRKPRGKNHPPEDIIQAFSRRRIRVERTIGRMRRYKCLRHSDRHHRQNHTPRVRAVAGLVNRQLRARFAY